MKIISKLQQLGVELVTGVPDSMLASFVAELQSNSQNFKLVVAPNEGNAIALAAGHFLGSGKPAIVYMQNSGLPNALNPLSSLTHRDVYGIPMVLLIGWRGSYDKNELQVNDEPQHLVQGSITRNQLNDLGIPFEIAAKNLDELANQISKMYKKSLDFMTPTAILVRPGILDTKVKKKIADTSLLSSEAAIVQTLSMLTTKSIIIGSTGMIGRELLKLSQNLPEFEHRIFLNIGAMGHTSAIGKGIALARRNTPIICFDGDGALAMHFGTVAMLPNLPNFKHVIINNRSHDSVGGQATSFGEHDLKNVLNDFSSGRYLQITNLDEVAKNSMRELLTSEHSCILEFICNSRDSHDLPRPEKHPREVTYDFLTYFDKSKPGYF